MICSKCQNDKPENAFYHYSYVTTYVCKQCKREASLKLLDNPNRKRYKTKNSTYRQHTNFKKIYKAYHSAKKRAKNKNREFDISIDDLINLWDSQQGRCVLSGEKFHEEHGAYSASLDRIDSKKGYTKGNIRFILFALNSALLDYGIETYLDIAEAVKKNMS
jgi:hypothetical protein